MIVNGRLRSQRRAGILHLVQTSRDVGWTAAAMTGDTAGDLRLIIGPSKVARATDSIAMKWDGVLAAPLGIERLLARRLRAWVARRGSSPQSIVAYGSNAGELARAAFSDIDRVVHRVPAPAARRNCARAAVDFWRAMADSRREATRRALGIRPETLLLVVGGDRADSIDSREAFAAVGRAVLAGVDVALMVTSGARWVSETVRYARRAGMTDRLLVIENAEIPSAMWQAVDAMLLLRPCDETIGPWWGWCAWWALAAGVPVVHESCLGEWAGECDGSVAFDRGDRSALVRMLIGFVEHERACLNDLRAGALRSASAVAAGQDPRCTTYVPAAIAATPKSA